MARNGTEGDVGTGTGRDGTDRDEKGGDGTAFPKFGELGLGRPQLSSSWGIFQTLLAETAPRADAKKREQSRAAVVAGRLC